MKLILISDTRRPTRADGRHGLGKSMHDLATGLRARGHEVTLLAHVDSEWDDLIPCSDEMDLANKAIGLPADAWLDGSHDHILSSFDPNLPVLNRIGDLECPYKPPNSVVATWDMQRRWTSARVIRTGINAAEIPFCPVPALHPYAAFMAPLDHENKGSDVVRDLHAALPDLDIRCEDDLVGESKWDFLGEARVLLHPSRYDAAPRLPLEAAACGTPTLCLNRSGTPEHVKNGLSGMVCLNIQEMVEALHDFIPTVDRAAIRAWVEKKFSLKIMIEAYDVSLLQLEHGERW